jgi:transposase
VGRERLVQASRDELIEHVLAAQEATQAAQEEARAMRSRLEAAEAQLHWLKQQLFGKKSERRLPLPPEGSHQLSLGESLARPAEAKETAGTPVRAHVRQPRRPKEEGDADPGLRFDDTVPVERIVVEDPALEGLREGVDYAVVSEKRSYRLAQRPASYTVLEIVRPVVKLARTGQLSTPAAPPAVLPGSYADVSLLAGILIDKLRYHLPLYRQHQRLSAAGITVSRASLTSWVHRTAELLEPIYEAQLASILAGRIVAMDETPIRAGRQKGSGKGRPGRMRTGYFWPLYGERDEVAFPFAPTRAHAHVEAILEGFAGTLLSDGYEAYARYAERCKALVHALCWAHARRGFVKAEDVEPVRAAHALERIRVLYEIEREIAARRLDGAAKLAVRGERSRPVVEAFFAWLEEELVQQALLPTNPFTKAALYALERRKGLEVFLTDPDVPLDTNHLERALRPIPMGRKAWLFCWTELGAQGVGQLQSLITTCGLQGVDPYIYLVDVLQRIDTHPFSQVDQLTPRRWKEHFADAPLRSLLDRATA